MIDLLAGSTAQSFPLIKEFSFFVDEHSCKEMYYNYALAMYEMGDHENCLRYLEKFESQLDKSDEIDWVAVKLFRDYLKLAGGDQKNSERMWDEQIEQYEKIMTEDKDSNLKSVALNNLLVIRNITGQHEGQTEFKAFDEITNPVKNKLSEKQNLLLKINKLSLMLRKNKIAETTKLLKEIESMEKD